MIDSTSPALTLLAVSRSQLPCEIYSFVMVMMLYTAAKNKQNGRELPLKDENNKARNIQLNEFAFSTFDVLNEIEAILNSAGKSPLKFLSFRESAHFADVWHYFAIQITIKWRLHLSTSRTRRGIEELHLFAKPIWRGFVHGTR